MNKDRVDESNRSAHCAIANASVSDVHGMISTTANSVFRLLSLCVCTIFGARSKEQTQFSSVVVRRYEKKECNFVVLNKNIGSKESGSSNSSNSNSPFHLPQPQLMITSLRSSMVLFLMLLLRSYMFSYPILISFILA